MQGSLASRAMAAAIGTGYNSAEGVTADAQRERIDALTEDYRNADLTVVERALLDYVLKLTRTPAAMTAADIQVLRSHGLTDRAIHDACAIAAYFAFVNRIADGLGVELETPRSAASDSCQGTGKSGET